MVTMDSSVAPRDHIPFFFFASLLQEISKAPSHAASSQRSRRPHMIFQCWSDDLKNKYSPLPSGTLAVIFRLLFPEEDRRRIYNIQEVTLARELSSIFPSGENQLVDWCGSTSSGCLGLELQHVIEKTWSGDCESGPLSIFVVDSLLDELSALSGFTHQSIRDQYRKHKRRKRNQVLHSLFYSLSPIEACYMTQIILKDLRPVMYPTICLGPSLGISMVPQPVVHMLSKVDVMKAWDPTGQFLRDSRSYAILEDAARAAEDPSTPGGPSVGTAVKIPKCQKGRSCASALQYFPDSKLLWAEIKYDGERAQIHLTRSAQEEPQITIFSKSGRDSTLDRWALHNLIRNALSNLGTGGRLYKFEKNVVLEAEMVAFHGHRVDEFWRIRSLVEQTAHGVRHRQRTITNNTQNSLSSELSLQHHLGLVFFDVLLLDDSSFLSTPYSERRAILESLITPVPGQALLADRVPVTLVDGLGPAERELTKIFAVTMAGCQEGLILKDSSAKYNDFRRPWVKLKKDYIDGYGDGVDLLLFCGRWEKQRGRELKVGPEIVTNFYIGVWANKETVLQHPAIVPHFYIYFEVSYGLKRDALDELNYLLKTSESVGCAFKEKRCERKLPYTFELRSGLPPPDFLLLEPLVAELYGAGFTKETASTYYSPRFPRLSKVFRRSERDWRDSLAAVELHEIACQSIGRDRKDKDIDNWCNELWGIPVSSSPSSPRKRKALAEVWEEKLLSTSEKLHKEWRTPDILFSRKKFAAKVLSPLTNLQSTEVKISISATKAGHGTTSVLQKSSPSRSRMKKRAEIPGYASSPESGQRKRCRLNIFSSSFIWFSPSCNDDETRDTRLRLRNFVRKEMQLHSLEALLTGCGWSYSVKCDVSISRGVIFVAQKDILDVNSILEVIGARKLVTKEDRAPILIFDIEALHDGLNDVDVDKALYVFN